MGFTIETVLLFGLVAAVMGSDQSVSPEKMKEAALVAVNDCKTKVGAADEDVKALQEHKLPTTEKGLCLLECLFNTALLMKDGKLHREGAVAFFTPAMKGDAENMKKMETMVDLCVKETSSVSDSCQAAKAIIKCTSKHGEEFGFVFPNHLRS